MTYLQKKQRISNMKIIFSFLSVLVLGAFTVPSDSYELTHVAYTVLSDSYELTHIAFTVPGDLYELTRSIFVESNVANFKR